MNNETKEVIKKVQEMSQLMFEIRLIKLRLASVMHKLESLSPKLNDESEDNDFLVLKL